MTRKTNIKLKKMLEELNECFQKIKSDAPFFRSVDVSYTTKTAIYNEENAGWLVKVKLKPPFIQDLSDLSDISFGLPDNVTSYYTTLFYDMDGVYIVYGFSLRNWFNGRDS